MTDKEKYALCEKTSRGIYDKWFSLDPLPSIHRYLCSCKVDLEKIGIDVKYMVNGTDLICGFFDAKTKKHIETYRSY